MGGSVHTEFLAEGTVAARGGQVAFGVEGDGGGVADEAGNMVAQSNGNYAATGRERVLDS